MIDLPCRMKDEAAKRTRVLMERRMAEAEKREGVVSQLKKEGILDRRHHLSGREIINCTIDVCA